MASSFRSRAADAPRVELLLHLPDGAPWRLSVSAGIERFIGHYPRLDGIAAAGALLEYRAISTA